MGFEIKKGVLKKYKEEPGVTEVVIPESVTKIGAYAFEDCKSLTSITIPDSVTIIGENAFEGCENLTSITIPDSVTKIENFAFFRCESLTSITIPDGVTEIGVDAFHFCKSLNSVNIPDSVTIIEEWTFCCASLTSISIPYGVTEIGDHAFHGCESLISITIPDSVTKIGERAFHGCESLISITIPDSVTKIGERAFFDCFILSSVTIPESVTKIGSYAFNSCFRLKEIKLHPDDPAIEFSYSHLSEDDELIQSEYNDVISGELEEAIGSAINMLRTGDYSDEDPKSVTIILLLQRYMRTKDEKTGGYISRHLDNLMRVCVPDRFISVIEALTQTDGILTPENIDRYIDLANEHEQREIMLDLIYYKEQKLGFKTPQERLSL